jgi:hypothetical protein
MSFLSPRILSLGFCRWGFRQPPLQPLVPHGKVTTSTRKQNGVARIFKATPHCNPRHSLSALSQHE